MSKRFEHVIDFQAPRDFEADHILELIELNKDAAVQYMSEWHYPGEHPTSDEDDIEWGSSTRVYQDGEGYILSWDPNLEIVELLYDTEFDSDDFDPDDPPPGNLGW